MDTTDNSEIDFEEPVSKKPKDSAQSMRSILKKGEKGTFQKGNSESNLSYLERR